MSWFVVFLGLLLALAGGGGLFASLDLLTTELGLLYATCGAIAFTGGFIVIAIGLLMRRVDALRHAFLRANENKPPDRSAPIVPPLLAGMEPVVLGEPGGTPPRETPPSEQVMTPEPSLSLESAEDIETAPINENRTGHLPSLEALEHVAHAPEPPTLVGRYSAGGANYTIYSDGSIEAETDQGAFKFASMSEFKSYIAAKKS